MGAGLSFFSSAYRAANAELLRQLALGRQSVAVAQLAGQHLGFDLLDDLLVEPCGLNLSIEVHIGMTTIPIIPSRGIFVKRVFRRIRIFGFVYRRISRYNQRLITNDQRSTSV